MNVKGFIDVTMTAYHGLKGFPTPWILDYQMEATATHETHNRSVTKLSTSTHTGTHIDVPAHFLRNGATLDKFSIEDFLGTGYLLDFSYKNSLDGIDIQDIKETGYQIGAGDIVIFRTDWSDHFPSKKYFSQAPFITQAAADFLCERNVKAIGVDTASVEDPRELSPQKASAIHQKLLGSGMYIIEGLTELKQIPEGQIEIICFPLKLKSADGAPARVALKPVK
ncbi:cyclase family protein [Natranaerobius thermophilus]|uniref:Cyclase family protein n=1 Tax=Natranaerobius thermophilus (strain ATCC BAA-1301 / DSM 18059 / JW/NM-WN-LF) TaxID=457570 RepID=B2A0H9_NATTJ|nr:cyclase family protein [Natranaerobius thermophilus]ACB84540.1 cyclase family protein [Natranaerobius thermophilus JW/NM-WN-LF]